MVSVRHILIPVVVLLLAAVSHSQPDAEQVTSIRTSLFAQSAAEALTHEIPDTNVSFLLLDARTGQLLASRWDDPSLPIPLGSLAKPFTALAYGERHEFRYPTHTCRGSKTGCWRPGGHGEVNLTSAIAFSCNSYFRFLTTDFSAANMLPTATHFGLNPPGGDIQGPELAGLGSRWRISPMHMAQAYLELLHGREHPAIAQILAGMKRSGVDGTGAEVGHALRSKTALVKTGTAACSHSQRAPGDGFTITMLPADDPRLLLMVRVHGVPGSIAAKTAGLMLRRIEE